MKARLPEAQEIANAVGHTTWNEDTATSSYWFYLDRKNQTQTVGYGKDKTTSDYAWLFNNLGNGSQDESNSSTCLYYGCTMAKANTSGDFAYWTSTSLAGSARNAWLVNHFGYLGSNRVTNAGGVRPVITLNSNI